MKMSTTLDKMRVLGEIVDLAPYQILHLFQLGAAEAYQGLIKQRPQPLYRLELRRHRWQEEQLDTLWYS